jgi:hypothetical protein
MDEARNLRCPVTDCNFVWCKECQQEIVPDGPEHSCDGSSEMKHLVEQQGWKYCPCKLIPSPRPQFPVVTGMQHAKYHARR